MLLPRVALPPHGPAVDPFTQQPRAFLFLLFVCFVPLSRGHSTSFTHLLLRFSFSTWFVSPEVWWPKEFESCHTQRALSQEVSLYLSSIICHIFQNHGRAWRLFLCLLSWCALQINPVGDKAQKGIYFTFSFLYTNGLTECAQNLCVGVLMFQVT